MKKERDPFQNPFGHAVRAALEGVFKELIEEGRPEGFRRALQELMRIRAAQTESASEALCFVRFLREAVQEELAREAGRNGGWDGIPEEYSLLEEHLHELTVIACDLFVESRKKIDAIRIKEIRAEKERLERAGKKFQINREMLKGKDVFLIDTLLVRGSTAVILIPKLRQAGVARIHLRLAAPPPRFPCFMGMAMAKPGELLATSRTDSQIRNLLGVDTFRYPSIEELRQLTNSRFCDACFSGKYPMVPKG
jgi:hypothetical protein